MAFTKTTGIAKTTKTIKTVTNKAAKCAGLSEITETTEIDLNTARDGVQNKGSPKRL